MLADFDDLTSINEADIAAAQLEAKQAHDTAVTQLVVASTLAALLAVAFGALIACSIALPVAAMQVAAERLAFGNRCRPRTAMSALAAGDLDGAHARVDVVALDVRGHDEVSALAASFATMQGAIAAIAVALDGATRSPQAAPGGCAMPLQGSQRSCQREPASG